MAKKFKLNNLIGFTISEFMAHVNAIADGEDPMFDPQYRDWYESHCELLRRLDACDINNELLANHSLPARSE
jgi:hypothetical protein